MLDKYTYPNRVNNPERGGFDKINLTNLYILTTKTLFSLLKSNHSLRLVKDRYDSVDDVLNLFVFQLTYISCKKIKLLKM